MAEKIEFFLPLVCSILGSISIKFSIRFLVSLKEALFFLQFIFSSSSFSVLFKSNSFSLIFDAEVMR